MLIVDALLCNIVRVQSRTVNDTELVEAVERDCSGGEIKQSWKKLFNYFSDARDESRKKFIKDIKRQSCKAMVEDIVNFLRSKDKKVDLSMLAMPWSYTLQELETDGERTSTTFQKQTAIDLERRFNDMELRLEKKQDELYS